MLSIRSGFLGSRVPGCGAESPYIEVIYAGTAGGKTRGVRTVRIIALKKKAVTGMRICSFNGCGRSHDSHGYCTRHAQLYRKGVPLRKLKKHLPRSASLRERLEFRTDKSGECWFWTGAKAGGGYGYLRYGGKSLRAHRVSYELNVGKIGEGMEVDHKCRNRACVKPDHLQAVSSQQNSENLSVRVDSSTGVRGVKLCKQTGRYAAQVKVKGKTYWGGRHSTIAEAEAAVVALRNKLCTNNLDDRVRASQTVPYIESETDDV